MVTAGIISVVIGGHFGGGDHFDGRDHFGGDTDIFIVYTQDVTDASVNTCCKLKLVFFEKRLYFSADSILKSNGDLISN